MEVAKFWEVIAYIKNTSENCRTKAHTQVNCLQHEILVTFFILVFYIFPCTKDMSSYKFYFIDVESMAQLPSIPPFYT